MSGCLRTETRAKKSLFILYYRSNEPELQTPQAGLIIGQLEYWFKNHPNGFYKFMEPCDHRCYKAGDSWSEELNIHRTSFTKTFSNFAVRYKSKSAFLEASEDPFAGKLYASYYDRDENKTYYLRNHDLANQVLRKKITGSPSHSVAQKAPQEREKSSLRNEPNARSEEGVYNNIYKLQKLNTLSAPTENPRSAKVADGGGEGREMIKIWNDFVEEKVDKVELTSARKSKLVRAFRAHFSADISQWKDYCRTIGNNSFLRGGGPRGWKASIDWALQIENIQKVREGVYTGQGSTQSNQIKQEKAIDFNINEFQGPEPWKRVCENLVSRVGIAVFNSWFRELVPLDLGEGETSKIKARSNFCANRINTFFERDLKEAVCSVFPNTHRVEVIA